MDYRLSPDPFRGWVGARNHLTRAPGLEHEGDVAASLHRLATAASRERISAWDPRHDKAIRQLREAPPQKHKRPSDLFAIPSTNALAEVDLPTRLVRGRDSKPSGMAQRARETVKMLRAIYGMITTV